MTHHLKTLPEYFQAVIAGTKPFEIRNNDRGFKPGDRVILEEFEAISKILLPRPRRNVRRLNMNYNEQEYLRDLIRKIDRLAAVHRLIVKEALKRGAGLNKDKRIYSNLTTGD